MAPEPAYTASEGILEDATALDVDPTTSEPVEEASKPPQLPTEPTDEERINALAVAILKTFEVPGRGYEGNRMLWESEDQLRQYLTADSVVYKESDLSAALTKLETAAVPGYDCRLVRGYELHRRQTPGVTWKMPPRAILLEQLHPFDFTTYEPCDIEPYVIPPLGA